MNYFKKIFSLFLCVLLAMVFQNCGGFVDETGEESSNELTQARANELSFAFKSSVDILGYMSCNGNSFHTAGEPYFSFKAMGLKEGSGVGFRQGFLNDFGGVADNKLIEYLGLSPRNANTGVIMSVRAAGNLQRPLEFDGGSGADLGSPQVSGLFYDPLQGLSLTRDVVTKVLLKNRGADTNYLKGLRGTQGKSFEGSIRLKQEGVGQASAFRNALQDSAYLSFTYATSSTDSIGSKANSPFSPKGDGREALSSVWGQGYQFTFSQEDTSRSSSPKRVILSVQGYDLETGASIGEGWVCPSSERYIIVRPADANRRFDGQAVTAANHPFNEFDADPEPPAAPTTYNDGGNATGGYYHSYKHDHDNDGVAEHSRRKVICPRVPDQVPDMVSQAANPNYNVDYENAAWKRVRAILPTEDWYVYRGHVEGKNRNYNCIVSKKSNNGGLCYGSATQATTGQSKDHQLSIQYFRNEDFPEKNIDIKRDNQEAPNATVGSDCGPGASAYCPHVLSVCYKLN